MDLRGKIKERLAQKAAVEWGETYKTQISGEGVAMHRALHMRFFFATIFGSEKGRGQTRLIRPRKCTLISG